MLLDCGDLLWRKMIEEIDVIKVVDHIIDVGLEGGKGGGTIVAEGTPEQIIKNKTSHTAKYLKKELH